MKDNKQINEYFDRFVKDKTHSKKVAQISLALFDKFNNILNIFNDADRELLYCGALLHDIGYSFEEKVHNKSGRDFILKNNIMNFSLLQNIQIANIIRYHRGKLPKPTHSLFMNLTSDIQNKTAILAGICRLSDGLDANHLSVVDNVDVCLSGDKFVLTVFLSDKIPKKQINPKNKKDLLELYLKRKIKIKFD